MACCVCHFGSFLLLPFLIDDPLPDRILFEQCRNERLCLRSFALLPELLYAADDAINVLLRIPLFDFFWKASTT